MRGGHLPKESAVEKAARERSERVRNKLNQARQRVAEAEAWEAEQAQAKSKVEDAQALADQRAREQRDLEEYRRKRREDLAARDQATQRAKVEKELKQEYKLEGLSDKLEMADDVLERLRGALNELNTQIGPKALHKHAHKIKKIIDDIVAGSPKLAKLEAEQRQVAETLAQLPAVLSIKKLSLRVATRDYRGALTERDQEQENLAKNPHYYMHVHHLTKAEDGALLSARRGEEVPQTARSKVHQLRADLDEARTPLDQAEDEVAETGFRFFRQVDKVVEGEASTVEKRRELQREAGRLGHVIVRERQAVRILTEKLVKDIVKVDALKGVEKAMNLHIEPLPPLLPTRLDLSKINVEEEPVKSSVRSPKKR